MKRALVFLVLLIAGAWPPSAGPAAASDMKAAAHVWRYNAPGRELPFPRSGRSQSVWASNACWDDFGSYCTWGMAGCLQADTQGRCLKLTDRCDRYCQRECRTRGGPLLPIEFPWD